MGLEAPESVQFIAEPDTASKQEKTEGCWRQGETLVILPTAALPHRCIKCNKPVQEPIKPRKIAYHNPSGHNLILAHFFGILAYVFSKSIIIKLGLCAAHKRRRLIGVLIGWFGSLLGLVLVIIGNNKSSDFVLAGLAIIVLAIVGFVLSRVIKVVEMDDTYVRLKGCGKAFLNSLPQIQVYIKTK